MVYWIGLGLAAAIWLGLLIWWATKPAKPYPGPYGNFRADYEVAGSHVNNGHE